MQDINNASMDFFCKGLKQARKLLGISQNELAEVVGHKGYQTISRYERGERFPDKSILVALSNRLNVSIDWLITSTIARRNGWDGRS